MSQSLYVLLLARPDAPLNPLEGALKGSGFVPRFECVSTKADFLRALDLDPDLVLAEIDLPRLPISDVLRLLHARGHDLPVLALVNPDHELDGLECVRHGAQDYVVTDHLARLGPAVATALELRRLRESGRLTAGQAIPTEAFFEGWFENAPFGLAITDAEGHLLRANGGLIRLVGYGAAALPRLRNLSRLFEPPESVQRIVRGLKVTSGPHQSTLVLRLADAGTREVLVTSIPVASPDGTRLLWTIEDVADWVQAERALQESRTEQAEVFAAALDGILMLDAQQRILLANPAAERVFGTTSKELIGHHVGEVLQLPEESGEGRGVLPAGGIILSARRAGQHDFPAEVTASRFRFRGADRHVVLVRDITERKTAEDRLRESEANYRSIFEGVQDAIMVQGLDGRILDVNQRACDLYGYSRDQFLALTAADLIHPARQPISSQELIARTRGGRLVETIDRRSDGSPIPVQLSARVQTMAGQDRLLVVVRDITEAKRAEQEIRRRAAYLEALHSIITATAAPGDARGLLRATVESTLQALGLPTGCAWAGNDWVCCGLPADRDPEAFYRTHSGLTETQGLVAVSDWAALPSDDLLERVEQDVHALGLRASLTVPIPMLEKTVGGMAVASPEPHAWSEEESNLVQAVAHQIGGAVHRLQLLHWAQGQARQLQTILDNAPEGFLVLDGKRGLRVANPLAEEYLRCLASFEPDGSLASLGGRPLTTLLAPGTAGSLHQIASSDHPPRVFDVLLNPILLDLETQGWVVTLREVTEQQHLLQEAEAQRNLAAIGRMAAGIAHDFNNLLGPILLHTEMMRRDALLPDRVRARLGTIQEQARRAADLVQQILDFSRKTILERRPIEMGAFLDEVMALLHRTMPESISLTFTREGEAFPVRGDSVRLQRAFLNLAANARDAMPEGGELRIGLKHVIVHPHDAPPFPEMEAGEWVRVTFDDTGPGIRPEDMPYIFEPFYSTKGAEGTGLGLAQVLGIVRQHDGFILADNRPEGGARFTLYLPLERGLPEEAVLPVLEPLAQGRGELVLVVEDNLATRQALCEILEMLNYRTVEAENGLRALEVLESRRDVALVISDMVMPQMGGKALHEMIAASYPATKVILMTGYPLGEEDRALLARKGVVWLGKPVGPELLATQVRRALGTSPLSQLRAGDQVSPEA